MLLLKKARLIEKERLPEFIFNSDAMSSTAFVNMYVHTGTTRLATRARHLLIFH
jgi:hypothetical protein